MSYTITWTPDAENDLAAAWLAGVDRNAITTAIDRIEQRLARNPLQTGEARDSSLRRIYVDRPLVITFEVVEDDKRVIVYSLIPLS